ncbi:putative MFS lactose permease [Hysterangium stoloniferum]|nr:putative MFS lactose permease [Hysterangium stoloniferum]
MDRFLSTPSPENKSSSHEELPDPAPPHNAALVQGHCIHPEHTIRTVEAPSRKLNPLSKHSIILYAVIVMTALCSFSGGYDIRFRDAFNPSNSAKATGLLFSIYPLGQLPGSLAASAICDRWGRRSAMFVGSIMVIIATAILTTSDTLGQFLAGRFLLGAGVSFTDIAAPTYCIEIAPSQWKGRMTGFYNINTHFPYSGHLGVVALSDTSLLPQWQGYSASTQVWGTSIIQTNWSWRIPLIIQIIPAFIVAISVWFCPESPRWLYIHGKEEQAYQILIRYHGNNDPNDGMVALEMSEFRTKINTGDAHKRWWDFTPLFKTRNARWRSLMVIMMAFFVQRSWISFPKGAYSLQIYQAAGFNCTPPFYPSLFLRLQFAMNMISTCIACLAGSISAAVSGSAICLALNAGFSAKWASYGNGPKDLRGLTCTVGIAAVSAFFLFSTVVIDIGSFISLYAIPVGFENLQWRFIELDDIFNEKNPVKASQFKRKVTVSER